MERRLAAILAADVVGLQPLRWPILACSFVTLIACGVEEGHLGLAVRLNFKEKQLEFGIGVNLGDVIVELGPAGACGHKRNFEGM